MLYSCTHMATVGFKGCVAVMRRRDVGHLGYVDCHTSHTTHLRPQLIQSNELLSLNRSLGLPIVSPLTHMTLNLRKIKKQAATVYLLNKFGNLFVYLCVVRLYVAIYKLIC